MKMRLFCLISLALATTSGFADTEALNLPGGYSLIADHLNASGGNTLNNILPNPPDGTQFYKWGCGSWMAYTFDVLLPGWTPDGLATLNPGEGAFIKLPVPATITFTGTHHVPVLPVVLPCGCDHLNLLSRQTTNTPTTFRDLTGFNPPEGTSLYRYNSGQPGGPGAPYAAPYYSVYTFSGGVWEPSTPTLNMSESAFVSGSYATNCFTNCCSGCTEPYPLSYQVVLPANVLKYCVNSLCHGTNNTLDTVLPNVPDATMLYKYAGGVWVPYQFFADGPT
jgi:hypothetical protein